MSTCVCSVAKAHFKVFAHCEKANCRWNTCKLTFCHYKDRFNYLPNGTFSHSQSRLKMRYFIISQQMT